MPRRITPHDDRVDRRLAYTKSANGFLLLSIVVAIVSTTTCRAGEDLFVQDASFPKSHVLAEAAILRTLHETTPVFSTRVTLAGIVTALRSEGISARLDNVALETLGISSDEQIDWRRSPLSLAVSLEQSLQDFDLTWIIRGGTLLITTEEKAEEEIRTKIYRVSGMVEVSRVPSLGRQTQQVAWQEGVDFDTLIETIALAIEPEAWDFLGGPGTIAGHVTGGHQFLIVSQTDRVHDKVEIFLRRLQHLGGTIRPGAVSLPTKLPQTSQLPEVGRDKWSRRSSRLPGSVPPGAGGFF